MVATAALLTHLDFSAWASRRLLQAATTLTAGELVRDFGTADRSVVGTLAHIQAADRAWLGRIEGSPPAVFLDPERDLSLASIQSSWPAILDRWLALDLSDPDRVVSYQDLKGNPWQTPLWQIVLHIVNHASHHRGQVAGFLRAMGRTPPPLDLIHYYRQQR
jgi:uncharacterized damage-inducible protein DinB